MRRVRVTGPARRDISHILKLSHYEFGAYARQRYRELIEQAIRDIAEDFSRIGVKAIDDVRQGYSIYHLKWSRERAAGHPVKRPRHVIAFYVDDSGAIILARVFHDRQLLNRHLPESGSER